MWAVRARGGVGMHWQPLNTLKTRRKCKPGVGSGQVGVGWGNPGRLVVPRSAQWHGVVPGRGGADIGVPLNYSTTIEIPLKYH